MKKQIYTLLTLNFIDYIITILNSYMYSIKYKTNIFSAFNNIEANKIWAWNIWNFIILKIWVIIIITYILLTIFKHKKELLNKFYYLIIWINIYYLYVIYIWLKLLFLLYNY